MIRLIFWSDSILDKLVISLHQVINVHRSAIKQVKCKSKNTFQALIGLAFSIGFIVGPLAGAWFSKNNDGSTGSWGERPAHYALGLALANVALVLFCIPETLPKVWNMIVNRFVFVCLNICT